ncbi:MAG: GNAT family N-acetyltransferase [Clostridia bacterium]|nr:GNAT family N-acetyltransferase [Clostridia bacterium]
MEKLRQQLVDLYMICFPEDTQTYAEFFVDNKWDGTNCMTLFEGEKLINMLFLVKKKMFLRGVVFDVPYMVAGGTLPEYRGRHIFTGVLLQGMKDLAASKHPITGLMPFLHTFYEKQAYVTHSYYVWQPVKKGNLPMKEIGFDNIDEMIKVYDSFMQDKNGWFYRDRDAMTLRLKEIFLEGGKAYGLYKDGNMQGYILTFDDENIDEYCALYPEVIDQFDTHFEEVKLNVPCDYPDAEQDNQLRICDNKYLLECIKYPEQIDTTVTFSVDDWFYKENSGKYKLVIKNGSAVVEQADEVEFALSIEEFTKLVSGTYRADEFDKKLQQIFPQVLNCALDKF